MVEENKKLLIVENEVVRRTIDTIGPFACYCFVL